MNPIDANTISNFTPLSREEFRSVMTDDLNESFLKKMPSTSEDIEENKIFDIIHVVEDVYLARGKIGAFTLEKRSCNNACAMSRYSCYTNDEHAEFREIPCEVNIGENPGYTAIRAQLLPTNGKKHKKEYIPDTPENFDFSPENWNSVKTMIGM